MSSARPKVFVVIGTSVLVAACASVGGGGSAPAKSSTGIWMGSAGAHAVQPLADKPRFGKPISEADLAAWNIDIRTPDGLGLPAGRGTVAEGKKCTRCRHISST